MMELAIYSRFLIYFCIYKYILYFICLFVCKQKNYEATHIKYKVASLITLPEFG